MYGVVKNGWDCESNGVLPPHEKGYFHSPAVKCRPMSENSNVPPSDALRLESVTPTQGIFAASKTSDSFFNKPKPHVTPRSRYITSESSRTPEPSTVSALQRLVLAKAKQDLENVAPVEALSDHVSFVAFAQASLCKIHLNGGSGNEVSVKMLSKALSESATHGELAEKTAWMEILWWEVSKLMEKMLADKDEGIEGTNNGRPPHKNGRLDWLARCCTRIKRETQTETCSRETQTISVVEKPPSSQLPQFGWSHDEQSAVHRKLLTVERATNTSTTTITPTTTITVIRDKKTRDSGMQTETEDPRQKFSRYGEIQRFAAMMEKMRAEKALETNGVGVQTVPEPIKEVKKYADVGTETMQAPTKSVGCTAKIENTPKVVASVMPGKVISSNAQQDSGGEWKEKYEKAQEQRDDFEHELIIRLGELQAIQANHCRTMSRARGHGARVCGLSDDMMDGSNEEEKKERCYESSEARFGEIMEGIPSKKAKPWNSYPRGPRKIIITPRKVTNRSPLMC